MEGTQQPDESESQETPQPRASRRTRSQQEPDWTLTDSLILVNEIGAVEGDCLDALSTYQKWKIIAENCTALGVSRTLNQYRRKWDTLLTEYNKIKQCEGRNGNKIEFDCELFNAIDVVVKAQKERSADSEPEEVDLDGDVAKSETRKQRHRLTPQKRRIKEEVEEEENINAEYCKRGNKEKEELLAARLHENAEMIHAILKGKLTDNMDCKLGDLKNDEASRINLARQQGDKLIDCFGVIVSTLDQLCDSLRKQ